MTAPINIQENFLNQVRKDGDTISVYLTSGFLLRGKIKSFDKFTLILNDRSGQQHLVYKHAIASVGIGTDQPIRIEDDQ